MSVDREILAEIHLNHSDSGDEKVQCMCTRIFLKNSFPIYASTLGNEEASEADDVFNERAELTSFRDKLKNSHENENDNDANSCYYSASHTEHTDNYYSTDDQEHILQHQQHAKIHSSDSGADLSERNVGGVGACVDDKHIDDNEVGQHYHHERNNSLPELFGDEVTQNAWEKYWAKNGERLIWQSWIEKYIDYINPEYLDVNKMPIFDAETSADSQKLSLDEGGQAFKFEAPTTSTEIIISSPARQPSIERDLMVQQGWSQLTPDNGPKNRQYLHQNSNDNLLSPRCDSMSSSIPFTIGATTDSMTNVTRMSCTSYGFESSHVTSESTSSSSSSEDSNSVSSFSSEESDQMATTRAAFECEKLLMQNKPEEQLSTTANDQDSEEDWQKRWQGHAQEQYVKHYNKFMEAHRILQDEMSSSFKSDSGFLPGEMAHSTSNSGGHKRRKKSGRKKGHSLQRLVANLHLRNDLTKHSKAATKPTETDIVTEADDTNQHEHSDSTIIDTTETSLMESLGLPTAFGARATKKNGDDDGGDEPPEEKPAVNLKRTHESEGDEAIVDHIKSQFDMMGYAFVETKNSESTTTKGEIVYRKKHVRLHNRMLKMLPSTSCKSKHIFFDDDGNEILESKDSEQENILQHSSSDDDAPIQPLNSRINNAIVPFTSQLSSDGNANEESQQKEEININLSIDDGVEESLQLNDEEKQAVRRERKRKRKGKFQTIIPVEIANDKVLRKYWYKRFSLFSFFDQGIQLDRESWFSVTPEKVAAYTAERCKCGIIVDGFCGVGGNCIQFAKTCDKVIAIDIDTKKIEMARHNAKIYGVEDKIDFIVGNYFDLIDGIQADIVYLSPPWGGPSYMKHDTVYDLEESLLPVAASKLMEATRRVTKDIVMYLPRNSNTKQLATLAGPGNAVEIEQNFLDRKLVAITAYYGDLVQKNIMK